ncbi:hypothetical protein RsoM2USA_454 [Ralstonia phage RsoM2USA]|nr:hypothetical protein RsoM2USA_454 [Ralstonia phage RsoM2USA]
MHFILYLNPYIREFWSKDVPGLLRPKIISLKYKSWEECERSAKFLAHEFLARINEEVTMHELRNPYLIDDHPDETATEFLERVAEDTMNWGIKEISRTIYSTSDDIDDWVVKYKLLDDDLEIKSQSVLNTLH